jgi:M-phase phosphoprotein 6
MWRPGAHYPIMSTSTNSPASSKGTKRPRSAEHTSTEPAQPTDVSSTSSPSARTARLSGVTRNMRFMQRSSNNGKVNDLRSRHSFPQRSKGPASATVESVVPSVDPETQDTYITSDMQENKATHVTLSNKISVTQWETATPLDMYGRDQCMVLGRRSFGGFNPITAANWYTQQQHLDHEEKQNHGNDFSNDERRRYKDLAKRARSDDAESAKRVKRRFGKNGISNQTKRGLDDVLQLD